MEERLEEWGERVGLVCGGSGQEGYFTTIGGKMLDPKVPIQGLGLADGMEVVYHVRLRGGGYGGNGKGGTGGSRPAVPGEWTCTTCWATRCWPVKTTCYQCGTARNDGGGRKDAGAGGVGAQAGVDTAMGRVVGPNGRNQVRVPGGDPTYRVNQGRKAGVGGKAGFLGVGGGKGNVTPGAGVGVGGGTVGVEAPLPVVVVYTDRDKILQTVELMKGLLGEEVGSAILEVVQGHLCRISSSPKLLLRTLSTCV